ncbi:MAG: hypothetical protein AB4426_30420 [Xenococcaceae cyanobacterium]
MVLSQVFERFVQESPISVMVGGLLEKILSPQKLDELFERNSQTQYTKNLPLVNFVVESNYVDSQLHLSNLSRRQTTRVAHGMVRNLSPFL